MATRILLPLLAAFILVGCTSTSTSGARTTGGDLTGVWRGRVRFSSGPFASISNLEFLYAFNAGGTMTESSNYDGAPPVPPAYGIWRPVERSTYEAKYIFYATQPPATFNDIATGGGWLPAGYGVFTERIELAADGSTFTSTMRYQQFDTADRLTAEGVATVEARRVEF
jgi:hypothetical protein